MTISNDTYFVITSSLLLMISDSRPLRLNLVIIILWWTRLKRLLSRLRKSLKAAKFRRYSFPFGPLLKKMRYHCTQPFHFRFRIVISHFLLRMAHKQNYLLRLGQLYMNAEECVWNIWRWRQCFFATHNINGDICATYQNIHIIFPFLPLLIHTTQIISKSNLDYRILQSRGIFSYG